MLKPSLVVSMLFVSARAFAQPNADQPPVPPTPPTDPTPPTPPAESPPPVIVPVAPMPPEHHDEDKKKEDKKKEDKPVLHSKFDATLYGFVEVDSIFDSTQGLNDLAGNAAIARPNTYTGDHGQTMFGARNSRIGIKLAAPVEDDIKASAQLEMDFLGNQAAGISEQSFWQNAPFRFRHMNVKLETPVVDVLIGQTWQLFGWQSMFHPNTVAIQGVPGQVYSRSPQIRLSKTFKSDDLQVDVAVAASRPPQRASATPDGQAGVKLTYNGRKAYHTAGSTGTALDGLAIGASVVGRRFAVDEFSAAPHSQVVRKGYGLSLDALIPIIGATKDHHENALTLTGSFTTGAGIADLYQSLSGGVGNPALANPDMTTPAPAYTPNVDNGLVLFYPDATAAGGFSLHPIQWTAELVGLQYYLPPSGKVWVSANYAHMHSDNAHLYGGAAKVWDTENWADGCLFVDLTSAVRLGGEFAWTSQKFVDGVKATDYRGQFSAFFIF